MANYRSGYKSRSKRGRSAGRRSTRYVKPRRRKAKRSRFDTTVQAVRLHQVGGSRGFGRRSAAEQGRSKASARAETELRENEGRWLGASRTMHRSDPRVPRFQAKTQRRGRRARSHARRAPGAFAWVAAIPLNGKTLFNGTVLVLLGWALIWFFASDRFYVQQVAASGNSYLPSEVLGRASGLRGYSVFWINPKQVEERIKAELPPVESVQVRHGFIEKGRFGAWTRLDVQERADEIVWQVAGQSYWVSEDGGLHEIPASVTEGEALTEVGPRGPRLVIRDMRPDPPAAADMAAIGGARELIRWLPEIQVLEYAPGTGLHYRHPRGWWVYLGTGGDMQERVRALRTVEARFAGENAPQPKLVDLRYPDNPYYR